MTGRNHDDQSTSKIELNPMNNSNDITVTDTDRESINRCNCSQCRGLAGTARVCFNNRKLAARMQGKALAKASALAFFLSCFFLQGPAPAKPTSTLGYLEVFSATQETQWGEGSFYYPHTGYRIFDAEGRTVKWVDNHDSDIDETPQKVELAPGTYTIWAQSDRDGYVKERVTISTARTTTLRLESDRDESQETSHIAKATKTPATQIDHGKA